MAIREIRKEGDPILRKECKTVKEMNERTKILIGDMFDTMYEADGVGLAGPQVGILKKIFVVDVGGEEPQPMVFINPEILEKDGEQTGSEGCLSVPGYQGEVTRAEHIRVRAFNENMEEFELEADGLLARCIQHEEDHLHGTLYVDKVNGELVDLSELEEEAAESGEDEA
ncbi:MAG: peptide deformylase [Lachnospiraceae bacterium]|nr:peptide deformylase [Lachnospiraceae bacterium]